MALLAAWDALPGPAGVDPAEKTLTVTVWLRAGWAWELLWQFDNAVPPDGNSRLARFVLVVLVLLAASWLAIEDAKWAAKINQFEEFDEGYYASQFEWTGEHLSDPPDRGGLGSRVGGLDYRGGLAALPRRS